MTLGRLVLIADDDEDIVRFIEVNLRLEGFEVAISVDGEAALQAAHELMPDLILLDVMMPKVDGFEVCQRLRADPRTKHMSIIMLTAKSLSADKVLGLTSGADDYMIKPFDPIELIARVKSSLRRSSEMRAVNPLTQLPGNVQVQEEVARLVAKGEPFALMYVDMDHFKAFNDHYGFLRGDEAIKLLGSCIVSSVTQHAERQGFAGHVGGDDFVAVVPPDVAEAIAKEIIECWDRSIPDLYDVEDARRGYVEIPNRQMEMQRFPVNTVSIGIATSVTRPINSQWEASEIATEMKQFAKRDPESAYRMDRRKATTRPPSLESTSTEEDTTPPE